MPDKDDFKNAVNAMSTPIQLGAGVSIDGYLMPNGEVRYGTGYLSRLLGYGRDYFLRATKEESKKLGNLIYLGYRGDLIPVKVKRLSGRGGTPRIETLSFDDFCILVEYEAIEVKNTKAIAVLTASFRELLRSRTQIAFELPEDTLEQKQSDFTAVARDRESAWNDYQENIRETEDLILSGDEHPYWNSPDRNYGDDYDQKYVS
jgi:hypothetical protein